MEKIIKSSNEKISAEVIKSPEEKKAAEFRQSINDLNGLDEKEKTYAAHWRDIYELNNEIARLVESGAAEGVVLDSESRKKMLAHGRNSIEQMEQNKIISEKKGKRIRNIVFNSLRQLGLVSENLNDKF